MNRKNGMTVVEVSIVIAILLLLIAKQALQRTTRQDSSADKANRPNISLPTLTYPSVATNIHSLY